VASGRADFSRARHPDGLILAARESSASMDLSNHTVLVIDDNEAVGTALDVMLSMHGVRVLTANGPEGGLALLRREPVDLVLQDMNFRREATRGEEGMALFREIRA